jgi:protein-disulfide isomerase
VAAKAKSIMLFSCLCLLCLRGFADPGADPRGTEALQVLEYLRAHPEFLLENPDLLERAAGLQRLRAERAADEGRRQMIRDRESSLLASNLTAVRGTPDAANTLIEFSDYQCLPCKQSSPAVEAFLHERTDLRLINLQLPVYGPQSTLAARAALIAQRTGHFQQYHLAMMQSSVPINLHTVEQALSLAGISAESFSIEGMDPGLSRYLDEVRAFATELGAIGTPTFILNGRIIHGGVNQESLRTALASSKATE